MEFAGHREMARSVGAEVYFARPCHSCDRGLNKHTNGPVRHYAGKAESLPEVDAESLRRAVDLTNHLPRKELGFRHPHKVFSAPRVPATPLGLTNPAPPPRRFAGGRPPPTRLINEEHGERSALASSTAESGCSLAREKPKASGNCFMLGLNGILRSFEAASLVDGLFASRCVGLSMSRNAGIARK